MAVSCTFCGWGSVTGSEAGDLPEVLVHPGPGLGLVVVSGDDQGGVVGSVPLPEEVPDILHGGVGQVLERTDDLPVVGVAFGIEELADDVAGLAVGLVVHALALLVLHHPLLVEKGLRGDGGEEVSHPVRLQPEGHLEGVVRNHLEIDGLIVGGPAVQGTPGRLDLLEELVLRHMLRGLEHHVLEEVGEARLPHLFPIGAHVVENGNGHHGIGPVLVKDHGQAVVELILLVGDLEIGAGRPAGGEKRKKDESAEDRQMTWESHGVPPVVLRVSLGADPARACLRVNAEPLILSENPRSRQEKRG